MPRYVQVQTDDGYTLVEVEKRQPQARIHLQTARPSYQSPVDGAAIEGRAAEREYMKRNNLMRPGEFGPNDGKEYFDRQAADRRKYFTGEAQAKEMKSDVIDAVQKTSQGYKPQLERQPDE